MLACEASDTTRAASFEFREFDGGDVEGSSSDGSVEVAEPIPTPCGDGGVPVVRLVWVAAPSAADSAELAGTTLVLRATNESSVSVSLSNVRVLGDTSGVPFEGLVEAGPVDLPAGHGHDFFADLTAHADLTGMRSAGAVEAFARVEAGGGSVLEQAASTPLYFHPVAAGGIDVYGADVLAATHGAGDVLGLAAAAGVDVADPTIRRIIVSPDLDAVAQE